MTLRIAMRIGTTLLQDEDPVEGELFWDPELRRIGVWNPTFLHIDWMQMPLTPEARTNLTTSTNYLLLPSDVNRIILRDNGAPNTINITVANDAKIPVGSTIDIIQQGTGQTLIVPANGITLHSLDEKRKLAGQWAAAKLIKVAEATWVLSGDIVS